jgi:hypothetical protein
MICIFSKAAAGVGVGVMVGVSVGEGVTVAVGGNGVCVAVAVLVGGRGVALGGTGVALGRGVAGVQAESSRTSRAMTKSGVLFNQDLCFVDPIGLISCSCSAETVPA